MRHLFLLVALLVTSLSSAHEQEEKHVHAKYFDNNVGGKTIITDRSKWCGAIGANDGYAYGASGEKVRFCWVIKGDGVWVQFEGGKDSGVWPLSAFKDMDEVPDVNIMFPENPKDL